ncbi:MAG TPA: deoxynucleoside kinase [Bellilinea sp.]|nr:deoxynucleoside kinase [Bellilinea sp.]
MQNKKLILVAGNIGSGKTTLTQKLGEAEGWLTGFESVATNPYLPNYYTDMKSWSFHLQIYFLGHRAEQHLEIWGAPHTAIIDRSIYEDAEIFAKAQYQLGTLTDQDYKTYLRLYSLIVNNLPAPSLLIYLTASVDTLLMRIQQRARSIEAGIPRDYLQLLETFYIDWIDRFTLCPVLTIHTEDLDFVHNAKHIDTILERVHEKLSGKDTLTFGSA